MRLYTVNISPATRRREPLIYIRSRIAVTAIVAAAVLLGACGGSGGGSGGGGLPPGIDPCTATGQVEAVLGAMQEDYFWNDEPEQADKYVGLVPGDFTDTDELLDFLRYRPSEFDRGFTNIASIEADNAFFGPGEFAGYGFSFQFDEAVDRMWITQVFSGSPAAAAGFARGVEILEVDGRTIAEIEANEGIGDAFGEREVGFTQTFLLQAIGGQPFSTTATKAIVTIDPVPQHRVIDAAGLKIGYVEFRTFINTAPPQLQTVFGEFAAAGVTHVIVDLRYNGGGLVAVAEYVASLLAGPASVSKLMSSTLYNSANGFRDFSTTFSSEINSIDLASVVFITTESSASASELVINALEPYIEVALVGSDTFGKPVGQDGFDFCDQRLRLVAFEIVNANGDGGFFDGLPADCAADDNLALPVGDANEDSLAAALTRVTTGACPIIGIRGGATLQSVSPSRAIPSSNPGRTAAREFAYAY